MAEKVTKIRIKAAKGAPEFVSHGNAGAENKRGYFETTDRKFADHIIASGYGTEDTKSEKPTPKAKPAAKPAKAAAAKTEASEPTAEKETGREGGTE